MLQMPDSSYIRDDIPDAPYIREAEMFGMPPYEDEPDFSEQIETLEKADKGIDTVVDFLLQVEDDLDGTIYENDFRDMIHAIENIGGDIRHEIDRVKGIA